MQTNNIFVVLPPWTCICTWRDLNYYFFGSALTLSRSVSLLPNTRIQIFHPHFSIQQNKWMKWKEKHDIQIHNQQNDFLNMEPFHMWVNPLSSIVLHVLLYFNFPLSMSAARSYCSHWEMWTTLPQREAVIKLVKTTQKTHHWDITLLLNRNICNKKTWPPYICSFLGSMLPQYMALSIC